MLTNTISLWNTDRDNPKPVLCDCGYRRRIGRGDGEASYFYDPKHNFYVCGGCGYVIYSARGHEERECEDEK